jgi:hypothetical protein
MPNQNDRYKRKNETFFDLSLDSANYAVDRSLCTEDRLVLVPTVDNRQCCSYSDEGAVLLCSYWQCRRRGRLTMTLCCRQCCRMNRRGCRATCWTTCSKNVLVRSPAPTTTTTITTTMTRREYNLHWRHVSAVLAFVKTKTKRIIT